MPWARNTLRTVREHSGQTQANRLARASMTAAPRSVGGSLSSRRVASGAVVWHVQVQRDSERERERDREREGETER